MREYLDNPHGLLIAPLTEDEDRALAAYLWRHQLGVPLVLRELLAAAVVFGRHADNPDGFTLPEAEYQAVRGRLIEAASHFYGEAIRGIEEAA